jgi:predicted GIY-YIG superfamily endonuclease
MYTIRFKDDDKFIYVGSTTNLKQRWLDHKNKATLGKFKHYLLYNCMSVYWHDKFYIQLYETLNFKVKDELLK